ncbi:MAG TPA: MFS transporter [Stellaceae bacterium]|jgi:MFS transporter, CP family, cyanate transporter|nr:MFS transporter [Stellaceae bacterium]
MARGDGAAAGTAAGWRFFLLWLAGIDLRLTILAVPPVLPLIHRDLGLDETSVAALTGLPVLLFALVAVPGSLLIARLGARRALIAGLVTVAFASAGRGLGASAPMLFAMTFVMGAGVATMQPALPALVSHWLQSRAALATAVYANGLLVGEVLAAGLTIPLVLPLVGGSWEWSFAFWGVPVLATALLIMLGTPHAAPHAAAPRLKWWPDWRDPRTWQLGLVQGGGSALYFATNAFIPDYLHATGQPALVNACLTALNSGQVPASFVLLLLARWLAGRKAPVILAALASLLSLGGLLVAVPAVMIASAVIIGFAAAFILILTLALPPLLVPPEEVHRLSAGVLTISYGLAFFVPLLGGAVWDATGFTATAFLPSAIGAVLVLVLGATLKPVRVDG